MKRHFAVLTGIAVAAFMTLSLAGSANAANETATTKLTMTPQSGKLSTTERSPVNWRTEVEIKAPFPASPKVQPIKNVKATFPLDMTFNPKSDTPICPDSAVGPDADLNFEPNTVIARCPKAVLGNGTAGLYLAGNQDGTGPTLKDPVLIVFNGGENSAGQPRLKIYGYSGGTGVGIYMEGALINGVLDISIPRLSFDSGTGDFNLNIPGSNAPQENRRGVDKTYVQAKCSTGKWTNGATFELGTRDSAGNPTSPTETLKAPDVTQNCTGVAPTSKFASVKIKGPGKAKKGKKTTYKVTVKNGGKASITNAKVKASGKGASGSASVGTLKAGKSKTVKVKVKFAKKGSIKTTFKATGKGAGAKSAKKTVKVS